MKRTLIIAAALALAGGAAEAKPGHAKRAAAPAETDGRADLDVDVSIILGERERDVVRAHYAAHCPPGLAKRQNGCLSPGQAKKGMPSASARRTASKSSSCRRK